MKRQLSTVVSYYTRSKKSRLVEQIPNNPNLDMVSASHLHNFMIDDSLVDWLKLKTRPGTRFSPAYTHQNGFSSFIMNKGIEFESQLVKYINTSHIPVISVSEYLTDEGCQKTIDLMKQGVPIIHSAPVKSVSTGTQGIIDLLVRSDYLDKLIITSPLSPEETNHNAPKLKHKFHYVVIDIKFSTLPLRADGIHLLNSGHYPAYKAQVYVYNEIVGEIQGYTPNYAFIMGRRWRYVKKEINHNNYTCLDRLGRVDFSGVDAGFPERVKDAIEWVRNVRQNGTMWSVNPPSRKELYPNMCVDSGKWNIEKERIAADIGEITNVWYLGTKHRNAGLMADIKSWRDVRCTAANLRFGGTRAPIVDKIMAINRQNKDKIWPKVIQGDTTDWKNSTNELFVDFETLSDIFSDFNDLPNQKNTDMIFMIGVGWQEHGKWCYKNYTCTTPTHDEEYRIMSEFKQFVRSRGNPLLRYWYAESQFWNAAECRQFDLTDDVERKDNITKNPCNWRDMYDLFQKEPIVLKGCFKFGLKPIAKAMKAHGMIKTCIESSCDSGMSAMINAIKCYQDSVTPVTSDMMVDIIKYNEFDCKVLWEILTYLRKNHTK